MVESLRTFGVQPAKALLAETGVSQNELARRYGLLVSTVNQALNGKRAPSLRVVEALEQITGHPVSKLFEPDRIVYCNWRMRELSTGSRRKAGDGA